MRVPTPGLPVRSRIRAVVVAGALLLGAASCTDGGTDGAPAGAPEASTVSTAGASTAPPDGSAVTPADPPRLTVTVVPGESQPLAPPPTSPVAAVRRDCGASVALPGGGAVWLFCDTVLFDEAGALRWFVNTSAAVATDQDPLVMLDAGADDGGPVEPLVTPGPVVPRCAPGEGRFTWPSAGVVVDGAAAADPAALPEGTSDDDDRVVALFYLNVCVTPGASVSGATGLAALAAPLVGRDATADRPVLTADRVVDQLVRPGPGGTAFGQAAVRVDDTVYLYRCPLEDRSCEVARAPARLAALADPDTWEVWTGRTWSADVGEVGPMQMPVPRRGVKPSVTYLPEADVYVWVDQRWTQPHLVQLRVATEPTGPWSEAVEVDLPGCEGLVPQACYGVEVHGHLSGPESLRLTWFDPEFPPGTPPGRTAALGIRLDPR